MPPQEDQDHPIRVCGDLFVHLALRSRFAPSHGSGSITKTSIYDVFSTQDDSEEEQAPPLRVYRDLFVRLALRSRSAPSHGSVSITKTNKIMGNSLLRISGTFQENVTPKQNDRKCALWMTAGETATGAQTI